MLRSRLRIGGSGPPAPPDALDDRGGRLVSDSESNGGSESYSDAEPDRLRDLCSRHALLQGERHVVPAETPAAVMTFPARRRAPSSAPLRAPQVCRARGSESWLAPLGGGRPPRPPPAGDDDHLGPRQLVGSDLRAEPRRR